jgi:hypothetical protein
VLDHYGVAHALMVEPYSGDGLDNRGQLEPFAFDAGRYKGMTVVRNNIGLERLQALAGQGRGGIAINAAYWARPLRATQCQCLKSCVC